MITSTSNPTVKNLIMLGKKAKTRKEQGVFLVEGLKMFDEAPREWIQEIFVSETFTQQEKNQKILLGIEYEVLSDHVMKAACDTQTPQGILCVMKQPVWELSDILKGDMPSVLFLESIQNPGNLGTMVRTVEGAGIGGIVVNRTTVDVYNPKVIRSTMGSIYRVPVCVAEDFTGSIRSMKQQGMSIYAAHLEGSVSYDVPDYRSSTGLLIGNEGNGLTEETAALSDTYIRIPMEGKVESLNAAIASALLMYEINRQRRG